MDDGDRDDDPFAGLAFDEDFVRGASVHEASAAEREQARVADLEEARRRRRRQERRERRARRPHRRLAAGVTGWVRRSPAAALVLVVLLAMAWVQTRGEGGDSTGALWGSGPQLTLGVGTDRPTPRAAVSDDPLGVPPEVPAGAGPYAFVATQPGSEDPVAYDPCRPIPVVFNHRTAPPEALRMANEAIEVVEGATGLRFEVEGTTEEPPSPQRAAFQPDRYGDRWAPLLVAWSDPVESPELAGFVAGFGGSNRLSGTSLPVEVYVTGSVVLDGPQLAELMARPNGWEQARAIVIHELGHVVGLDHVDDPTQLMNPAGSADVTLPATGDRAGLAQLGQGECLPEL